MNWKHLLWIVPLIPLTFLVSFFIGLFAMAWFEVNNPMSPENNMDMAIINLQQHCLKDEFNNKTNVDFCDGFIGVNESEACKGNGLLQKYVWKWIQDVKEHKGALSRQLGIQEKDNIPFLLLEKIMVADVGETIQNPTQKGHGKIHVTELLKKRVNFALNVKRIKR